MANNQLNKSIQVWESRESNGNEFNQPKVETKTITNIYYDCLERIFDCLDLEDLLNVARTCKRLQIAAAVKFSDVYGKKCITMNSVRILENHRIRIWNPYEIRMCGLDLCLPFLRCFGSKILNLRVQFKYQNSYLDQYVNKYCTDTLTSITYNNQNRFLFTKPFNNVETLTLTNTKLCDKLSSLVKWFPKLRHLNFEYIFDNISSFGVFFPHLEQVTLNIACNSIFINESLEYQAITDPNVRDRLTIENAKDFLHANQQINIIKIISMHGLTLTTVLNMISRNPSILTLNIHIIRGHTDVDTDEVNRLTSEHPFLVELSAISYRFEGDDAIFIIRQLNSLKKIAISMKNRVECDRLLNQMGSEWKIEYLCDLFDNPGYTGHVGAILKRQKL